MDYVCPFIVQIWRKTQIWRVIYKQDATTRTAAIVIANTAPVNKNKKKKKKISNYRIAG